LKFWFMKADRTIVQSAPESRTNCSPRCAPTSPPAREEDQPPRSGRDRQLCE
jgi:hypothetical protein